MGNNRISLPVKDREFTSMCEHMWCGALFPVDKGSTKHSLSVTKKIASRQAEALSGQTENDTEVFKKRCGENG